MNDQQALQRYARFGDAEAFHYLVQTYQRLVYAACRRHLRDEADVEDAAQETFLKLAEHAGRVRRNLAGWLHRCATHASITRVRREATRRRHELAWAPADNTDAARWRDIMAEVDAALDELDAADRELIMSYYLGGETQSSLAGQRGVSRTGVQHRLNRSVERLRGVLRRRGVTTSAAALTAFFVQDAAHAQVPGALTVGLTKLGLSGAGAGAFSSGTGATVLASGKVAWAGAAALVATVGTVGVVELTSDPPPPKLTTNAAITTPLAGATASVAMGAADENGSLRDPAFDRPIHFITVPHGQPFHSAFDAEAMTMTAYDGDVRLVYDITDHDAAADPPTLDLTLNRIEGPATGEQRQEVGQTAKGVYRIQNQGRCLIVATRRPGERRPGRVPASFFDRPDGVKILVLGRLSPPEVPNDDPPDSGLDPGLAGPWYEADNCILRPDDGRLLIYEATDPYGSEVGELIVRQWDVDANPKRLGGVVRISTPDGHEAKPRRYIYGMDRKGRLRLAMFEDGSPFQNQYPAGFNDRREGIVHAVAVDYEP